MIPEVSILDGLDGVSVSIGKYRIDGVDGHPYPCIFKKCTFSIKIKGFS
jgi:hypothetical protein